ncbi:MAG: aminotransferase class V-fold PLP-dependent enzyme, partial [Verrucomicrobiota bacterium]
MEPIPDSLTALLTEESYRQREFPVTESTLFFGHAGVTALPRCVADAVCDYTQACSRSDQEFDGVLRRIEDVRATCAELIGARPGEIALLGPTSLGLSLFANGLSWNPGDEVLCYRDDYPANVYPWKNLERQGVVIRYVEPEVPGAITPELVEASLSPKTRLVALASCHFLSGQRIDVDAIGKLVHEHGALFSLDAIQTLGAFETKVDHVDFLSADSHKWLLGPLAAGIVYVAEEHFERLRPTLIGAWNVRSPQYVAQETIEFEPSARRYEPGVLNCAGIFGMQAAITMILNLGLPTISERLLHLRKYLGEGLTSRGFSVWEPKDRHLRSGITTVSGP